MNILEGEIAEVAREVERRLAQDRVSYAVYVDDGGDVFMERPNDPRRKYDRPAEFLVGTYTPKGSPDIEGDLEDRRDELAVAA